jgi:hypothetical protein
VIAPNEPASLHLEVDGWYRRGGRRWTAHVTTEELSAAILAGLPAELGPWHLTGADSRVGADGRREWLTWTRDEVVLDRPDMWIWSSALTRSHPPLSDGAKYDTWCSYNGFLHVQSATEPLWRPSANRPTARDVSVVDAVYTATGDLVTHPHYLSVWRRIVRRLRALADQPGPAHPHPLRDGYRWSPAALAEAEALL